MMAEQMEDMPNNEDALPTPWSEVETMHAQHATWPQWRVIRGGWENAEAEIEIRIPVEDGEPIPMTLSRLDVKAMFIDVETADMKAGGRS